MSRIEQLIAELCPDGVEYKEIESLINDKSILTITPPSKLTKSLYKSVGTFPIIDQGKDFIVGYTNDKEKTITEGFYIVFGDHTEAIKYVDFTFAQGADGIKILKTDNERIIAKYLYYSLNNFYIKTGKYTRHFSFLRKTSIPIPPLPIQQEIVRILDTFTDLDAELQAELEARKKQYEHYRNQLLNFEGKEVEWKTLGEVCKFSQGIQIGLNKQTTEYQEGKLRFIRIIDFTQGNQVPRYVDINDRRYLVEEDDISMVRYGEAGFVCTGLRGILANNLFKITPLMEGLNKRFLYHALKSSIVQTPIKNSIKQGSLPAISFNIFKFISIPTPPLPEQERIVSMLDKFEALVNEELPAEISARRKQYEHYREKLLTFEPPVS